MPDRLENSTNPAHAAAAILMKRQKQNKLHNQIQREPKCYPHKAPDTSQAVRAKPKKNSVGARRVNQQRLWELL